LHVHARRTTQHKQQKFHRPPRILAIHWVEWVGWDLGSVGTNNSIMLVQERQDPIGKYCAKQDPSPKVGKPARGPISHRPGDVWECLCELMVSKRLAKVFESTGVDNETQANFMNKQAARRRPKHRTLRNSGSENSRGHVRRSSTKAVQYPAGDVVK